MTPSPTCRRILLSLGALLAAATPSFASLVSIAPKPVLASVLYDAAPAALSIIEVSAAEPWRAHRRLVLLPAPVGEKAICQAVASDGRRTSIWVVTRTRLFEVASPTGKIATNLPLPDELLGSVVDVVAWPEGESDRVALALSPPPGQGSPSIVVLDGRSGKKLARYTAEGAGMTAIHSFHRDGDLFALYNLRQGPPGYSSITGLIWDRTGFSETRNMYIPGPGALRGDAALSRIGPGWGAAISFAGNFVVLVELFGPGTLEPFPELEWGEGIVAAGGDLDRVPEESEAPVYAVDAATGSLLHRSPADPQGPLVRLDLAAAGAPPSAGSGIVVSRAGGCGAVTSPEGDSILLFDPAEVSFRGLVRTPLPRPSAILLLP
jgi:hypothetical protein